MSSSWPLVYYSLPKFNVQELLLSMSFRRTRESCYVNMAGKLSIDLAKRESTQGILQRLLILSRKSLGLVQQPGMLDTPPFTPCD
ncbi:hypothetical protein BDV06DRAFT_204605, partial [Aspergillus oleicola]